MQGGQKRAKNPKFNKVISNADIDEMECIDHTFLCFL